MFHSGYYKHVIVQKESELKELKDLISRASIIFYDTETSGLRVRYPGNDFVAGFTIAFDDDTDKRVFYIPVAHEFEGVYKSPRIDFSKAKLNPEDFPDFDESEMYGEFYNVSLDAAIDVVRGIFEKNNAIKVAHNGSFDWHVMSNCGIDLSYMFKNLLFDDTMIMCHTVNEEEEKKLESVVKRIYGLIKCDLKDILTTVTNEEKKSLGYKANQNVPYTLVQIPIGGRYSCEDVWFTKQLYFDVIEALKEDETYEAYCTLRKPFTPVLWKMERRGVNFDKKRAQEMQVLAEKELEKLEYKMYEIAGIEININSDDQMAALLFGHVKITKDKKTGEYHEKPDTKIIAKNFGLPIISWTDGGKAKDKKLRRPQADKDVIAQLLKRDFVKPRQQEGKEFIKLLHLYNKLKHLYDNYIVGMQEQLYQDGRIHASMNQAGTDSGRISSSDPNLNNKPRPVENPKKPKREDFADEKGFQFEMNRYKEELKEYEYWIRFEIRSLIIPSEGNIIIASDFNNMEKRLTACFSGDEALLKMFREGLDGHGLIATMIFEELAGVHPNDVKKKRPDLRQKGKQFGFLMDYGGTEYGLSEGLGITKEEALTYIDKYYEGFKGLSDYYQKNIRFCKDNGYILSILGRKRHLPRINSDDKWIRGYCERLTKNFPAQGGNADITIQAQVAMDSDCVLNAIGVFMILQVYDEVVFEVPIRYKNIAMERIKDKMEHTLQVPLELPIPVGIDCGMTYSAAK
jgi:DNA polymerase-1